MQTKPTDETMAFIVPPECGGQIVEVAYSHHADDDGWLWRRTTDRSDRSVAYARVHQDDLWEQYPNGWHWEPWNCEPEVAGDLWR